MTHVHITQCFVVMYLYRRMSVLTADSSVVFRRSLIGRLLGITPVFIRKPQRKRTLLHISADLRAIGAFALTHTPVHMCTYIHDFLW